LVALGGLPHWLSDGWARSLAVLASPEIILQVVIVAAIAFLTLWLGHRFDLFLKRLAFAAAPRQWVPGIVRAFAPIS